MNVSARLTLLVLTASLAAPLFAAPKEPCTAVLVGSVQQQSTPPGGDRGRSDEERRNNRVFHGENRNATTFSATAILDIDLAILFSESASAKFAQPRVVEFRLYTPRGKLYESQSIPFTSDAKRKGERLRVPGYPDVVPLRVLSGVTHKKTRGVIATIRMPVAGTPIMNNSLYGLWRAEAFLDGDTTPCSVPAEFTITP